MTPRSAREWGASAAIAGALAAAFWLPVGHPRFDAAVLGSLHLVRDYAREHVLTCLVPAFFIAGAIAVFVSRAAVMKYLGGSANKVLAYAVASVAGMVLAVCSCTVLPLFAGIYRMGAGLGPATAFLYSGPAINVLAIILTARVLGAALGLARAVGAVLFSIIIGLAMHFIFRKDGSREMDAQEPQTGPETMRPLWQNGLYFGSMAGVLVFANWAQPQQPAGLWHAVYCARWVLTAGFAATLCVVLVLWFSLRWWKLAAAAVPVALAAALVPRTPAVPFSLGVVGLVLAAGSSGDEARDWLGQTWGFARQILPLLLIGVLVAGALLGRPGHEGLVPSRWVQAAVGGNSLRANLLASVAGALMYFATLTEVPILQGLLGAGMGKGPALALLLAGPALSLPNMLVIRSVLGTKKALAFVMLVVAMATVAGAAYGALAGYGG